MSSRKGNNCVYFHNFNQKLSFFLVSYNFIFTFCYSVLAIQARKKRHKAKHRQKTEEKRRYVPDILPVYPFFRQRTNHSYGARLALLIPLTAVLHVDGKLFIVLSPKEKVNTIQNKDIIKLN